MSNARWITVPNLVLTCLLLVTGSGLADEKTPNRYPYDPSCAWGRLSDGKGMLVRCLTESESAQLASAKGAGAPPAATASAPKPPENVTAAKKPNDSLEADVASVTADEGNLAIARKKLRAARDQYIRCVTEGGGLSADIGEVTVRFLVRERGRAEGANVEKHVGVSETAARCIAAVVDRRPVGTPEGPVVGATAVIRVTRQSKH
jgi:hypothetical protein